MTGKAVLLLLVLCSVDLAVSHICIISPRQRGAFDISTSANPTCFRHGAPCGGQAPVNPLVTYIAGSTAFIKWQQNLNHYEPGFPGYMDLAIAPSVDSTNFTLLAVVTDPYEHQQNHQRNYTAVVKMPMMTCEHCVLRARYNAHKPGETTFYQCADVRIQAASPSLNYQPMPPATKEFRAVRKLLRHNKRQRTVNYNADEVKLYGLAYNPFQPGKSSYVSVSATTGRIEKLTSYQVGIDSLSTHAQHRARDSGVAGGKGGNSNTSGMFFLDEVLAVDYLSNTSAMMFHSSDSRDQPASLLARVKSKNGTAVALELISKFDNSPINAMTWYKKDTFLTLSIEEAPEKQGSYYFVIGMLDDNSMYSKLAQIDTPEGLYVNYQWLETGRANSNVYALFGNENSLETLAARIYTFDVESKKYQGMVELDVSKFTFTSMHSFPGTGKLYAFSPGLFTDAVTTWSLVAVDPSTGSVTKHCDVGPAGVFQRYYGGAVFTGLNNKDILLYHVMRVAESEADVIVGVDPRSCAVSYSDVTNLRHIHNLASLCSSNVPNACL